MPGAQVASGIRYTQIADTSFFFIVSSYLSEIVVHQAKVSPWQPWIKKKSGCTARGCA